MKEQLLPLLQWVLQQLVLVIRRQQPTQKEISARRPHVSHFDQPRNFVLWNRVEKGLLCTDVYRHNSAAFVVDEAHCIKEWYVFSYCLPYNLIFYMDLP